MSERDSTRDEHDENRVGDYVRVRLEITCFFSLAEYLGATSLRSLRDGFGGIDCSGELCFRQLSVVCGSSV